MNYEKIMILLAVLVWLGYISYLRLLSSVLSAGYDAGDVSLGIFSLFVLTIWRSECRSTSPGAGVRVVSR